MKHHLKRLLSTLIVFCMILGVMPAAFAVDAEDEINSHWAAEALTAFIEAGYLKGDERGYRPDDDITRAELMALINRVAELTEASDAVSQYTDVSPDSWYYEEVAKALAAGYINGTSDTTISPKRNTTRQEAITMISRLLDLTPEDEEGTLGEYQDSDAIQSYAKPHIAAAIELGLINGYTDHTIRPSKNITRAEVVTILYRFLSLFQGETYVLMNIPYDDFYAAEISGNDVAVDAVSSATLNKTRTASLAGGSYHVNPEGSDISGITYPVLVSEDVDLSAYKQVTDEDSVTIKVTNRGQTSETTYYGKEALFENEDYAYYVLDEEPSYYKVLHTDEKGNLVFGEAVGEVTTVEDATADFTLDTGYGDYELDLTVPAFGDDTIVYGVVVNTAEGSGYGLRHVENIWRMTHLAWSTGFVTTTHGCDLHYAHYVSMMGQTITGVTYYTNHGIFKIPIAETYVPVKFDGSLAVADASAGSGTTAVTVHGLPADYEAVYAVQGKADWNVEDGLLHYTDGKNGQYTLTVSDKTGKYAPLHTTFELTVAAPAVYSAEHKSLTAAEGTSAEAFAAYVKAIASVSVNGTRYAASGRGAVTVIQENGAINTEAAPLTEPGTYVLVVESIGYEDLTFTYTVEAVNGTYEGKATTVAVPDAEGYKDFTDYDITVDVEVENGLIKGVAITSSYDTGNSKYVNWALNGKTGISGLIEQLAGKSATEEVTEYDVVTGATCSSKAIVTAVNDALKDLRVAG